MNMKSNEMHNRGKWKKKKKKKKKRKLMSNEIWLYENQLVQAVRRVRNKINLGT